MYDLFLINERNEKNSFVFQIHTDLNTSIEQFL